MQVPRGRGSMVRAEAPALRPRLCPHYQPHGINNASVVVERQWQSPTRFATADTADLGPQNSATCQDGTSITKGILIQRY